MDDHYKIEYGRVIKSRVNSALKQSMADWYKVKYKVKVQIKLQCWVPSELQ